METTSENKAERQARAELEIIREMMADLSEASRRGEYGLADEIRQEINESSLSAEIVNGHGEPEEATYRILLCTGGPAVRIVGELSENGEVETADLQYQDWFTNWAKVELEDRDKATLIAFAGQSLLFWPLLPRPE